MKVQYKNRTYKQTNWSCCDCELVRWQMELSYYYIDCPSLVKSNCCNYGFTKKLFNDEIFKL